MNRFPHLRRGRTRRGYTLIELLVVISMSAVATGGSLICISTMLKGERITAVAVHESQVVARLRQMWHDDVHLAQEWNFGSAEQNGVSQCELSFKDGRKVRYRSSNRGLIRYVQKKDGLEERDVFQFAEGTHYEFHQIERPRLARLKAIRPAAYSSAMPSAASKSLPNVLGTVVMTFDAALGREARLIEYSQTQQEAK